MSARALLSVAALGAVVTATAGCGWKDHVDNRSATAGLPDPRQLVQEHEWVLDPVDSSPTLDADSPVTFAVVDTTISGTAPCNAYRGDISLGSLGHDDSVEISDLALTDRACDRSILEAEDEVVAALETVDTVDTDRDDNNRLVLRGDGVHLAFRPYDADEVLAATWTVVDISPDDPDDGVLPGTEPALVFDDTGDVTVETGCNRAGGTWSLDGHALSIDLVQITQVACDRPTGVMDQEAALVAALDAADRVEIAPDQIAVLDRDETLTLVARRSPR